MSISHLPKQKTKKKIIDYEKNGLSVICSKQEICAKVANAYSCVKKFTKKCIKKIVYETKNTKSRKFAIGCSCQFNEQICAFNIELNKSGESSILKQQLFISNLCLRTFREKRGMLEDIYNTITPLTPATCTLGETECGEFYS